MVIGYRFNYNGGIPDPIKKMVLTETLFGAEGKEFHLYKTQPGFWLDINDLTMPLDQAFFHVFRGIYNKYGQDALKNLELAGVKIDNGNTIDKPTDYDSGAWKSAKDYLAKNILAKQL